jgi:branched-chain amino acid transport system permease protein
MAIVQHAIDAITLGSAYALYALGIGVVFGILGLINFAHGELIMVGAYSLMVIGHPGWALVIVSTICTSTVLALTMERTIFRPLRGASQATLLIGSFAASYLLQNLVILTESSAPKGVNISTWLGGSYSFSKVSVPNLALVTVAVTIVSVTTLSVCLKRTRIGVELRAAAEDFPTARTLGVNANRVIATAFAISGTLAGIGAYLLVAQTGEVSPGMGSQPLLYAFVAAVLGGLGSLRGAAIGGYVFGALTVTLQAALPGSLVPYRDAFAFAAVTTVLLLRPDGLVLGRPALREV